MDLLQCLCFWRLKCKNTECSFINILIILILPQKERKKTGLLLNFVDNKSFLIFCFTLLECASYFNEQAIWWWSWRTVQLASCLQPNVPLLADCVSGVISVLLQCDISVNTCSQPENIFISIYFWIAANLIMLLWMWHCRNHFVCSSAKVFDSQLCGAPGGSCERAGLVGRWKNTHQHTSEYKRFQ